MNDNKILRFIKKKDLKKKLTLFPKKKSINKKSKIFFKLKKKWRFWRFFKKNFLSSKKITFFEKINSRFNQIRIIYHQLNKIYSRRINNVIFNKLKQKKNTFRFIFFFKLFELKLSTILLRSRFFYKMINSFNAIRLKLISVNGILINDTKFSVEVKDLIQKLRVKKNKKFAIYSRIKRLKWRNFRWKKARFLFWKIRRQSHFNLFWTKKQNTFLNYLEINYKIPAFIILRSPLIKEISLLRQNKLITSILLKKIYFLY